MEQFLPYRSAELEEQLQELQERLKLQQLAHTQELQALKLQLHQEKLQLQERTELLSSEVTHQGEHPHMLLHGKLHLLSSFSTPFQLQE